MLYSKSRITIPMIVMVLLSFFCPKKTQTNSLEESDSQGVKRCKSLRDPYGPVLQEEPEQISRRTQPQRSLLCTHACCVQGVEQCNQNMCSVQCVGRYSTPLHHHDDNSLPATKGNEGEQDEVPESMTESWLKVIRTW